MDHGSIGVWGGWSPIATRNALLLPPPPPPPWSELKARRSACPASEPVRPPHWRKPAGVVGERSGPPGESSAPKLCARLR
eukprot:1210820-Rhodomonas_salina.1